MEASWDLLAGDNCFPVNCIVVAADGWSDRLVSCETGCGGGVGDDRSSSTQALNIKISYVVVFFLSQFFAEFGVMIKLKHVPIRA